MAHTPAHDPSDSASLPRRIRSKIDRVSRRTRLRAEERAEIAALLTREAHQRLASGEPEETILASLSPVSRTARRLRRDALAGAPIRRAKWTLATWSKRLLLGSTLTVIATYTALAFRYHTASPVPSRNFMAEHNARFDDIPPHDLAAPIYRRLQQELEPLDDPERGTLGREWPNIYPGDPLWPEAIDYLARHREQIELLQDATSKPVAGFRLSAGPHLFEGTSNGPTDPEHAANPPVLDLILDSLGVYRSFARLLSVDARAAAEAGEPERCAADIRAMLGICPHAEEHETLIGDLVSLTIHNLAADTLADVLIHHPGLFDHETLSALDDSFDSYMKGDIRADFTGEQRLIEDITQRMYTLNSSGNGRLCAEGLRYFDTMGGDTGSMRLGSGALSAALGPIVAMVMPTRQELADRRTIMFERLDNEYVSTPLWEWNSEPSTVIDTEIGGGTAQFRFTLLHILMPAFTKALVVHELTAQTRDAARVLIALERYRLDHQTFPDSLDALVPGYIDEVPPDRFDGLPIRYRLSELGTPVLYSVGTNRLDDLGVPVDGDKYGSRAKRWVPPDEAALADPGDWTILPTPRPAPYTADEDE